MNKSSDPTPRLLLAPMEGVMESVMREMLTAIGGYERCVTEFVRVSSTVLPPKVFHRLCPELKNEGRTASGTPVYVQLLGSDPALMAANAKIVAKLGAPGIDLNFGCPAKTVNKSRGGATLLKTPELIFDICKAVRDATPVDTPVTAKVRLGFDDDSGFADIADYAIKSGINELTVHARTKVQAYRPPAHWSQLGTISNQRGIPIIANGEIWTPSDLDRCREQSGCDAFMLARGALCRPDLGRAIKAHAESVPVNPMSWPEVAELLIQFFEANGARYDRKYSINPLKQWLVYLQYCYPQAAALFAQVKRIRDPDDMMCALLGATQKRPASAAA
ncbi:MAG: tRNA-dihydrouridine synthase [Pseudomonadota bacterium]|nr:tRNA-dihydrouridine synthase [Pseudomonadota bacterium]